MIYPNFRKNFFYFFLFILITASLPVGCRKNDCLKKYGNNITEKRNIPPIKKVTVYDNIQLNIIPDSTYFIEIIYSENLIQNIKVETDYKDSSLTVRNKTKCNWLRRYDKTPIINLHTPYLREVVSYTYKPIIFKDTLNIPYFVPSKKNEYTHFHFITRVFRTGDVRLLLKCKPCHIENQINGAGNIYLNGEIGIVTTALNHSGYYFAQDAKTGYDFIYHHGLGDAYIYVTKGFQIIIMNSGNVYVKGQGKYFEERIIQGTGKIIRIP